MSPLITARLESAPPVRPLKKKKKAVSAMSLRLLQRSRYCPLLASRDPGSGLAGFSLSAPASHRQGNAIKQFLLLS